MFIFRLFSSIILVSLFLTSILWISLPAYLIFMVFGALFAFLTVQEFLKMLEKVDKKSFPVFTGVVGALDLVAIMLFPIIHLPIRLFMVFIIICWCLLLTAKNDKAVLDKILNSISAYFLIIIPLSFLVKIYIMGEGSSYQGRTLLLFLVIVTKSGDIGAYVIGTLSSKIMPGGNHKIVPGISPKKSWEGTLGGMATSIGACLLSWSLLNLNLPTYATVVVGAVLFVGGFVGDLVESALKRICGVKDSGSMLPGLGGTMDVLDSLLLNAPIFYFFLTMIN